MFPETQSFHPLPIACRLIVIAAGALQSHLLPPSEWFCLLYPPPILSLIYHFRCPSPHATLNLDHHLLIIRPTAQSPRPFLGFPCSYCGKNCIWGASVKLLPTPCAPLHLLPSHFLWDTVVGFSSASTLMSNHGACELRLTFGKRVRSFIYFVKALGNDCH